LQPLEFVERHLPTFEHEAGLGQRAEIDHGVHHKVEAKLGTDQVMFGSS